MIHKLEADGIQLNFGERRILSDIYIKCETGKITGLFGRNGQGKSCLMNIIYGSLPAYAKSVRIDNISFTQAFKKPELLLYLPQFHFIPASLSLKRILTDFGLSFESFRNLFPDFSTHYHSAIGNLSGGLRRLVEVYVIIKSRLQFAMLDEPFSHLMPLHINKIKEMLVEEKNNKGFLITYYMYKHVMEIADDKYLLVNGKLRYINSEVDLDNLGYAHL